MRWIKKTSLLLIMAVLIGTTKVNASEEMRNISISDSDVYRRAFYAALSIMIIMGVLWLIIFRPKFNSSNEEF